MANLLEAGRTPFAGSSASRWFGDPERLRRTLDRLGPFVTIAAVLITWEVLARAQIVTPFLLPALSVVAARVVEDSPPGNWCSTSA